MKLSSKEIQGDEFTLNEGIFEQGKDFMIEKALPQIGDISQVSIVMDESDIGRFICSVVIIEFKANNWEFPCSGVLNKFNNVMTLNVQNLISYDINIVSDTDKNLQTEEPIFIGIQGSQGASNLYVKSYFFSFSRKTDWGQYHLKSRLICLTLGCCNAFICKASQTKNIGVHIQNLSPSKIQIQKYGGPFDEFENTNAQTISCPDNCRISFCKPGEKQIQMDDDPQMEPNQDIEPGDIPLPNQDPNSENTSMFNCNELSTEEKQNLKLINCKTTGIKLFEQEVYIGENLNYEAVFVQCPSKCLGEGTVLGRGIHHHDSTVCSSAIADGSMPKSGGCVAVVKTSGLNRYPQTVKTNGVVINSADKADWSFYTYKVDNPDFSKSDIRILNSKGQPDFEGRVEMRIAGVWGTVSAKGSEQSAAIYFCKAMNYVFGEFLNGETKSFCSEFNQKDHCGFQGQPVHYQGYKCESDADSLADCYREIAEQFNQDHAQDLIIRCSMLDMAAQNEVQPKEGAVRMLGVNGAPSTQNLGRVQIFKSAKWGTVCNKGWTDDSAKVACLQMGFDGGQAIGQSAQFKSCIVGKENYCGEENEQLLVENLTCLGSEKRLVECGGVFETKCSNYQSAMVKCSGLQGDSSGISQSQKDASVTRSNPKPKLGNLPLANPYVIDCTQILDDQNFKGDPGSIYLVYCPPGCKDADATVYGKGVYFKQSSICKSGIHSGVLQQKGGLMTVIVSFPQLSYESSTNRLIESQKYGFGSKSFMLAHTQLNHQKWSLLSYNAPEITGLIDQFQPDLVQPPLRQSPTSFLQLKNRILHKKMEKASLAFKNYLKKSSMIEIQPYNVIFSWIPEQNFKFTGKELPDLTGLEKDDSLNQMQTFTIMTKFQIQKDTGNVEIVGHSECGCWGLLLTQQGLEFGSKCTDSMINLGFQIAIDRQYHIALSYDKISQKLTLVADGTLIFEDKIDFQFVCQGAIQIGGNSFSDSQKIVGNIFYIQIFDTAIPKRALFEKSSGPVPVISKNSLENTSAAVKELRMTKDNRNCVRPCVTDPFPEEHNCPDTPPESQLGISSGGSGSEGLENDDNEDALPVSNQRIYLQCEDTLLDDRLKGSVGDEFRAFCPKGCLLSKAFVIGTAIYYQTSSICKASIHNGKILDYEGGDILVKLVNPIKHFQGEYSNDITSLEFQSESTQLSFVVQKPSQLFTITCFTTGLDPIFIDAVSITSVLCPSKCSFVPHVVIGTKDYAEHSLICQAAIHDGVLTDQGGELGILFQKSKPLYTQSFNNQINSQTSDNHQHQVRRSFIFIGNPVQACAYFTESFEDSSLSEWDKEEGKKLAVNDPSEWGTVESKVNPLKRALVQNSKIQARNSGEYGTFLINKKFDCANALVKFNLLFPKKSQVGIFFRYYDENNFYVLKLNTEKEPTLILAKKSAGVSQEMFFYDLDFELNVLYRFYLVIHEQKISLNVQKGDFRNIPQIFSISDKDIQRGRFALATNGEAQVMFEGLSVQPYDPSNGIIDIKSQQVRTWDQCLKPASAVHRERYCKAVNGDSKWAISSCKKLINYCQYCCINIIPQWEKILFWDCQKTCVKATRNHEILLRKNESKSNEFKQYLPKVGDKIDFAPLGQKFYMPANVLKITKNEEGQMIVLVGFQLSSNLYKKEYVDFPNPKDRIQICGRILIDRKDCVKDDEQ